MKRVALCVLVVSASILFLVGCQSVGEGVPKYGAKPAAPTAPAQAQEERVVEAAGTFIGTVTSGNMAKGVGFSNLNVRLEVTADNGGKTIFYVRSDSKVIDVSGKQINYLEASRIKGKKVEIQYFTIRDATGGDPSRSDFAYEIGQKGVLLLRILN
jgi:hypothetical protein